MQNSNTFSILFWIYTARAKNNQCKIYVRITVNGKRTNLSLNRSIDPDSWDSARQRVNGNSEITRQINTLLDLVHSQILAAYNELSFSGKLVTAELIRAKFLNQSDDGKTLLDIIDYHAKKIENTLAKGSIRNFGVSEGYLKRFLSQKLKTPNVYLSELNYKFICDYESFLHGYWPKGHPKAMGNNTVMKHIQRLRKITTLAYHLEWIERDPFVRWKPSFEKNDREFLSEHELSDLVGYPFPIERLERARDIFVFSCYTGIAYADLVCLTKDNIVRGIDGDYWIMAKRTKTKTPFKIPLLPKAQELIEKYDGHPITCISGTLFPSITNQKLNLYLKEIADACGIAKNLTFHMARHTFATTVTLTNGVPIETVSKLLGHTKLATTQIYARVIDRKVSEDMAVLRQKLAKPISHKRR
ncbi:site-specific integrase [Arenibacter sp. GZD96]|uniref:site-specific integrase n=1 Tax=Aurantibrevibacter litoralis TaxID=3106030 RepID=UPI002AFDD475|nr:site-specific integrase [Arenibacter sp. GZD-96]MEA1785436.1 site-specific integrase [Arenibacter sp. GZD-96]